MRGSNQLSRRLKSLDRKLTIKHPLSKFRFSEDRIQKLLFGKTQFRTGSTELPSGLVWDRSKCSIISLIQIISDSVIVSKYNNYRRVLLQSLKILLSKNSNKKVDMNEIYRRVSKIRVAFSNEEDVKSRFPKKYHVKNLPPYHCRKEDYITGNSVSYPDDSKVCFAPQDRWI